jgi:hypothetical protein
MRYGAEFQFASPTPRRLMKPRSAVTRAVAEPMSFPVAGDSLPACNGRYSTPS